MLIIRVNIKFVMVVLDSMNLTNNLKLADGALCTVIIITIIKITIINQSIVCSHTLASQLFQISIFLKYSQHLTHILIITSNQLKGNKSLIIINVIIYFQWYLLLHIPKETPCRASPCLQNKSSKRKTKKTKLDILSFF